jgi:hypothetical protein
VHLVPGFEDEALGAVLAVLGDFLLFEDAEGLAGEILRARGIWLVFCGVEDVLKFMAGQRGSSRNSTWMPALRCQRS